MMGMRLQGRDVFVVVSYDFEYITEEGKEVWMKEGEVLLLLSKTNNDWWQVIRRGDRRPFYAPARYVMELKPDQGDWDSTWGGESVHYRSDNGEPLPSRLEPFNTDRKSQFSTFLGNPLPLNNANKRSSYSPSSTHTTHGPQSSDFLFGAPRFQERYRSNSMDSILVQDMSRQIFQPRPDKIHSMRQFGPPGMVIPTQAQINLEKRPTFDNIDKRASWSAEKSVGYNQPHHAQHPPRTYPVYTNSGIMPATLPHQGIPSKKPIPLPRSKIPVPTKSATIDRATVQPELRTFKRSKTDLSLNMLSNYKAGRALSAGAQNRNAPLNIIKANSNPPPKQKSAQLRSRPSNRSNRPAVISEESHHSLMNDARQKESLIINEKPFIHKFKINKISNNNKKDSMPGGTPSKPAIKEKPSLMNHKSAANILDKKPSTAQISRVRSESDLILKVESELSNKLIDVEPPTIKNHKDMKISLKVEAHLDKRKSLEDVLKKLESKENIVPAANTNHQVILDPVKKCKNRKVTNEKFLEMETLPEPPPTPPELKKASSPIEISKPLIISTEPMSVSSCSNTKTEDKSNCSSYDSLDGSLDSAVSIGNEWPEGGDWLGSEPNREVKSPNNSTCSRSPPSPQPTMAPTRHVMQDWDEFLDVSGRKFYYNAKTHEKSWKPPRRTRGSSEGYSAPTSPDPFNEETFDMITEHGNMNPEKVNDVGKSALEVNNDLTNGHNKINENHTRTLEKHRKISDNLNNKLATLEKIKVKDLQEVIENKVENKVDSNDSDVGEASTSQVVPSGYEVKYENTGDEGEKYFVNMFTGVAWYTAKDKNGRVYYYEENGNESCWSLPNVSQTIQDHSVNPSPVPEKSLKEAERSSASGSDTSKATDKSNHKEDESEPTKTESLRQKFYHSNSNIQIGDVSIVVIKQGPLNKTKITENGKKYRKHWSISNVVLTDTFLLFFKDSKAFLEKGNKPDYCVDLKGAYIEWCNSDKSKRSNVFEISTVLEQKLLMQDDDFTVANDWFCRMENVIVALSQRDLVDGGEDQRAMLDSASSTMKSGKGGKVSRTKSLKLKLLTTSEELLSKDSTDSPVVVNVPLVKEKSRIREKLRKFFMRRPNVEELMKRGIMKNEPVFGSTLQLLARSEQSEVPQFVKKCISIIESKPDYLSTDGVYRQSGNLSVVQRLRLQIDQGNLGVLDNVDDVHVLTGALKLFFRELKEPLIPWDAVEKLLNAVNLPGKKGKVRGLRDVIIKLPAPNHITLIFLLKHLEKVTSYKDVNRMAVANLAIVFGPTLMWPPAHLTTTNMALNMMQQNMIVEALITNLNMIS